MITGQHSAHQESEFSLLLQIAVAHGFSTAEDERANRQLILYRGTPATDLFIHAVGVSAPECLDLRIIRYNKKLAPQPIGTEPDTITRLPLFIGMVDAADETALRAILKATVGSL